MPLGFSFDNFIASAVGAATSSTSRRSASCPTSSITGSRPVSPASDHQTFALPGELLFHRQRCMTERVRNLFDGFFLRLRISLSSITTSCSYTTPSICIDPNESALRNASYTSRRVFAVSGYPLYSSDARRHVWSRTRMDAGGHSTGESRRFYRFRPEICDQTWPPGRARSRSAAPEASIHLGQCLDPVN